MSRVRKEIKENMISEITKLSMLFLQLLLCFIMCLSSFISYYEIKQQKDKFENTYGENQFLRIEDARTNSYEEFISQSNYLGKMKSVYQKMMNSEVFTYLPEFTNQVYLSGIQDHKGYSKMLFDNSEDSGFSLECYDGKSYLYYGVNGVWIGKDVLETYGLEPESGRFFQDKDLAPIHTGDTVPIILGADYKEYYSLGDHIKGDIMIANVNFEVIGFLKKGATMKLIELGHSKFVELDRFVVVPLPDYPNTMDTDDEEAQRMIYEMKTLGFVYTDKNPDTVQAEVNKICREVGYEPALKVQSSTNHEDAELMMDMNTISSISFALSLILIIFSVMTFSLTMVNSIRKNMRYYAVLITNGYTFADLLIIILSAPFLVEAAALISGGLIILFVEEEAHYFTLLMKGMLFTLLTALMIFFIIAAVTLREFKRHDIANYLRRK